MKKWTVYYYANNGFREGLEHMHAPTREEAIKLYRHFFNVSSHFTVNAIPCFDRVKA